MISLRRREESEKPQTITPKRRRSLLVVLLWDLRYDEEMQTHHQNAVQTTTGFIETIDLKNANTKLSQERIKALIKIQGDHFYSEKTKQSGFFVTVWTSDEVHGLIKSGSVIHLLLNENKELIAYLVISKINRFTEQLKGAEHQFDLAQIKNPEDWRYLHQIGVASNLTKRGFGTFLLHFVLKTYHQNSLVSDYMISPKINISSANLFGKNGFLKSGILHLKDYRGFRPSMWQVVIWRIKS